MEENTEHSTDKRLDNLRPAWKGGESGNPNGRPKGQRNYATIYREALVKLASLNNKTPEDLEDEMVSAALVNARKGDYAFYRDVLDRLHGKPMQKTDITSGGKPIIQVASEVATKHDIAPSPINDSQE